MGNILILKKLKELGLSAYEAKSYLALLEKETLTVTEVAKIAEIPRTNAYEALEKLLIKGLCISKPGKIKNFSASNPTLLEEKTIAAIENTFEKEISQLREKQDQMLEQKKTVRLNVSKLINELKPIYKDSRSENNPLEYIEIIKDPYQIHKKFIQLVGESKKEISAFVKPPFSSPRKGLEEQSKQQVGLLKGGIRIRAIYEIPKEKEEIEWRFKDIDISTRYGEESRVIKELPMKMSIFDERVVMFGLADPVSGKTSLTTQIVEHPDLAKSLKVTFEAYWEQAEDYHVLRDLGGVSKYE